MAVPFTREPGPGLRAGGDALVQWAERTGRRSGGAPRRGRITLWRDGQVGWIYAQQSSGRIH